MSGGNCTRWQPWLQCASAFTVPTHSFIQPYSKYCSSKQTMALCNDAFFCNLQNFMDISPTLPRFSMNSNGAYVHTSWCARSARNRACAQLVLNASCSGSFHAFLENLFKPPLYGFVFLATHILIRMMRTACRSLR